MPTTHIQKTLGLKQEMLWAPVLEELVSGPWTLWYIISRSLEILHLLSLTPKFFFHFQVWSFTLLCLSPRDTSEIPVPSRTEASLAQRPSIPAGRAQPAPAAAFHARDVLSFEAVHHLDKQCCCLFRQLKKIPSYHWHAAEHVRS